MSEILVNKLTGTSTAGSILVTGEGNSTTTNLQQGLAKHFVAYKSDSSTAVLNSQSLNNSSLTDDGTGSTTFTFTNNMTQASYPIPDSGGENNGGFSTFVDIDSGNISTSSYRYITGTAAYDAADTKFHSCMVLGDLA